MEEKALDQYALTKPEQLSLFEFIQPDEKRYSNTIELYDFAPKYQWGRTERIGGEFLRNLKREFECRGARYKIEISPARIEDKDGKVKEHFPGTREELVEDALRRLVTAQHGVFIDGEAGVTFTLNKLQEELADHGHTYSKDQIKEALLICAGTGITIITANGETLLKSNIFTALGLQTRKEGKLSKAYVQFNPLISSSIKSGSYRQLDYETSMKYTSVIARQLHKRMSHHFIQADFTNTFNILLSTIIRDFGMAEYARPSLNYNQVIKALEQMKALNVIISYKVEKTTGERNKLIDAKFILKPHMFFVGEIKKANARANKIQSEIRTLKQ